MDLLEVGRITKPHGIRGEVVVHLTTDRTERVTPGTVLYTGDGRVLKVLASRPHQGNWIVAFDGLHDRNGSDALRGAVLSAEPLDDPDALWVHELLGADVVLAGGDGTVIATVRAVEANPASDLLVLSTGALVPMVFVTGRDDTGRVAIDPPAGLLEVNDPSV